MPLCPTCGHPLPTPTAETPKTYVHDEKALGKAMREINLAAEGEREGTR